MKVRVEIVLSAPDNFSGAGPWSAEQTIFSYIKHWLEEGAYCGDYQVNLPDGIEYNGFELEFKK